MNLTTLLLLQSLLWAEVNETNIPNSLLSRIATVQKNVRPLEREFMKAIRSGKRDEAEKLCRKMIEAAPFAPGGYYNLACIHALNGKKDEALKVLEEAIDRGFNNVLHLQTDPDLNSLHDELKFATLVQKAEKYEIKTEFKPVPFEVKTQTAWVEDSNVGMHPELKMLYASYQFSDAPPEPRVISKFGGNVEALLTRWHKEGTAEGNWGDLYDNRDGNHSDISRAKFPQLTWIEYSENAKASRLHWGLATTIFQQGVVIGNASVAQTSGPFWRSMPRMAHSNQRSVDYLYWQYTHNQVYVYPCHVDYPRNPKEVEEKKRHDVYPTHSPYLIASQGSSGSDRVFLRALMATAAAFKPEVKEFLVEKGMLSPTLQYIFRRSNKQVTNDETYFTGVAHPNVFTGAQVDVERMVTLAHEMETSAIPPLIKLRVIEEEEFQNGRDFFAAPGRSERLFDSPCSIARVFRGHQKWRRIVVSADGGSDVKGKPLSFRWSILRGDEELISIRPLNKNGSRVEIKIAWHPRRPISPDSAIESNRVDIGAFALGNIHPSAPAFITFFSLDHETREYDETERIVRITYRGAKEKAKYTDPVVALPKSWRDEYDYDDAGKLTGWTRHRGKEVQTFNSNGELLRKEDDGTVEAQSVRYLVKQRKGQSPVLVQAPVK